MAIDHLKENWSKHAVVYQIYPRSFKDSNGDGIGDLRGIIEKLDYLNDGTENSLGINAIWINPIYKSPQEDFGYDVSDYYAIDPIFGTSEDFDKLVEEAHRRGIKVIMDFVPNHTSSEHSWFKESRSSKINPKRDWYVWKKGKNGEPPNNWISVFGGSAWTKDEITGEYYMHSFLPSQPDLNWRNQEVKNEMEKVLKFWLARGVDGFRTDAIYHLIEDSEFRDDPINPDYVEGRDDPYNKLIHKYSSGQEETLETAKAFCDIIGKEENAFLLSEAYLAIPEMAKLYQACENNVHAPFNFNLIDMEWSAKKYRSFIDKFDASLDKGQMPNYVFGNHDKSRIVTRLGFDKARLAAMILLTLRGMPFIYYGAEIGMEDVNISVNKYVDPWAKNTNLFKAGRDPERTPMQWSGERNAGFTTGKPWLPINQNYKAVNVEEERKNPNSMFNLYRKLIHLRKNLMALIHGDYKSIDLGNDEVFAYIREYNNEKVMVIANFSDKEQKIAYKEMRAVKIACSTHVDRDFGKEIELDNFSLKPYEGYVFTV